MNLLPNFVQDSSITKSELRKHHLGQYHAPPWGAQHIGGFDIKNHILCTFVQIYKSKTINDKTLIG